MAEKNIDIEETEELNDTPVEETDKQAEEPTEGASETKEQEKNSRTNTYALWQSLTTIANVHSRSVQN